MLSLCQGLTYDQTVVVYRLGKVCKWRCKPAPLPLGAKERTNWACVISSLNIRARANFLLAQTTFVSTCLSHDGVCRFGSRVPDEVNRFEYVPSQFSNLRMTSRITKCSELALYFDSGLCLRNELCAHNSSPLAALQDASALERPKFQTRAPVNHLCVHDGVRLIVGRELKFLTSENCMHSQKRESIA